MINNAFTTAEEIQVAIACGGNNNSFFPTLSPLSAISTGIREDIMAATWDIVSNMSRNTILRATRNAITIFVDV
jgi:hypothetical protein